MVELPAGTPTGAEHKPKVVFSEMYLITIDGDPLMFHQEEVSRVIDLVRKGEHVNAIKEICAITGTSLVMAKHAADAIKYQMEKHEEIEKAIKALRKLVEDEVPSKGSEAATSDGEVKAA
jgi:ribosomal protein L7/L12